VGNNEKVDVSAAAGRPVILVPGQVEDDASIMLGCEDVRTNMDLLLSVRTKRPDAFIVYKPHPDVVGKNRKGVCRAIQTGAHCDMIVEEAQIADCLDVADEVHCMTSLVGFEALLRGIEVHVYGKPFYSGWGLTFDRFNISRRTRSLSLDILVAGALIKYPRYVNAQTGQFTIPEQIVLSLKDARISVKERRLKMPRLTRQLRKLVHLWQELINAD